MGNYRFTVTPGNAGIPAGELRCLARASWNESFEKLTGDPVKERSS